MQARASFMNVVLFALTLVAVLTSCQSKGREQGTFSNQDAAGIGGGAGDSAGGGGTAGAAGMAASGGGSGGSAGSAGRGGSLGGSGGAPVGSAGAGGRAGSGGSSGSAGATGTGGSLGGAPVQPVEGRVNVLTQHYDNARTGWNPNETVLTAAMVKTGKYGPLFSRHLDAMIAGQVLIVNNVLVAGAMRASVMVALTSTGNGPTSLWAFDAESANQAAPLWKLNFSMKADPDTSATPVIDSATGTIYAVTKVGGANELHAVDLTTGMEKPGSPVKIAGSAPGNGDGSSGGMVSFDSLQHNCTAALLLLKVGGKPTVYAAFGSKKDKGPFHGWVFGYSYDQAKFTQTGVYCTTPNGHGGGIWQGGKGLAADVNNNIYLATGDGTFDNASAAADKGMSLLKLSTPDLKVLDWFTPANQAVWSSSNADFGSSGPVIIPGTDRIFIGATKYGGAYLVNANSMGHWGGAPPAADTSLQYLNGQVASQYCGAFGGGPNPIGFIGTAGTFVCLGSGVMHMYGYDAAMGKFSSPDPVYRSSSGVAMVVSSNGPNNVLLWSENDGDALYAFDGDIKHYLGQVKFGTIGHFQFPVVANGRVYVSGATDIVVIGVKP